MLINAPLERRARVLYSRASFPPRGLIPMLPIPGKTCGSCTMCCKVLEIEHFKKPAGAWCRHCNHAGGCHIYLERPEVCREFECEWMLDRKMAPLLRPDRVGTILMEDADSDEFRAVCDPAKPMAWLNPHVFKYLVALAKSGRIVVAKAGLKAWRIHASGEYGPVA